MVCLNISIIIHIKPFTDQLAVNDFLLILTILWKSIFQMKFQIIIGLFQYICRLRWFLRQCRRLIKSGILCIKFRKILFQSFLCCCQNFRKNHLRSLLSISQWKAVLLFIINKHRILRLNHLLFIQRITLFQLIRQCLTIICKKILHRQCQCILVCLVVSNLILLILQCLNIGFVIAGHLNILSADPALCILERNRQGIIFHRIFQFLSRLINRQPFNIHLIQRRSRIKNILISITSCHKIPTAESGYQHNDHHSDDPCCF